MKATSKAARVSVLPYLNETQRKIHKAMLGMDNGGTFEQIAKVCGLMPHQVWKRLSEMQRKDVIIDTGRVAKGSSGRNCTVWAAKK